MKLEDAFKLCTNTKTLSCGCTQINCIKGLWGVSANSELAVIREAMHYFLQYHQDGEYTDIINLKEQTKP